MTKISETIGALSAIEDQLKALTKTVVSYRKELEQLPPQADPATPLQDQAPGVPAEPNNALTSSASTGNSDAPVTSTDTVAPDSAGSASSAEETPTEDTPPQEEVKEEPKAEAPPESEDVTPEMLRDKFGELTKTIGRDKAASYFKGLGYPSLHEIPEDQRGSVYESVCKQIAKAA